MGGTADGHSKKENNNVYIILLYEDNLEPNTKHLGLRSKPVGGVQPMAIPRRKNNNVYIILV